MLKSIEVGGSHYAKRTRNAVAHYSSGLVHHVGSEEAAGVLYKLYKRMIYGDPLPHPQYAHGVLVDTGPCQRIKGKTWLFSCPPTLYSVRKYTVNESSP